MTTPQYLSKLDHYINGAWVQPTSGKGQDVVNPATNQPIAKLGYASKADLDAAIKAADAGFKVWRKTSAFERAKILRKAADLVRARVDRIATALTFEQGRFWPKPSSRSWARADVIDWFADEGRSAYGRIIPARADGVRNMVIMEPVGPVAGFSPWNFPVAAGDPKNRAALAAGCSIIIKCPEETPGSPIEFVKCFEEAGVPAGVINLRLRRAGGDIGVSHRASDDPQDLLHRLGAGRQAAGLARRPAHEARHYGAWRPRAGDGVR